MPSVREMLEKQKLIAQKSGRLSGSNIKEKPIKPSGIPCEHLLSKERRIHHKQFFRNIYCGWVSPYILIQTKDDGEWNTECHESEPYLDPELIELNNFHCNQEEIKTILNWVIDKKDFYENIMKAKQIPDSTDCFINVNFQSNPTECYIHCTFVLNYGELEQIDLQGNIPKNIQSVDLGTYSIKDGFLEFNRY